MLWLRMIPSDEARQSRRGVKKYFEFQGEPIDFSVLSDHDDHESEDDDDDDDEEEEEHGDFMEEEEGRLDMVQI